MRGTGSNFDRVVRKRRREDALNEREQPFVSDARGKPFAPSPAGRLVSLVPSITETLFALGVGDRVVGRTEWCIAPRDAVDAIPTIGGTKTVDVEAVLALAPDLVLANHEENTREAVDAIERHVPVYVTYPRTVAEAAAMCRALAQLTRAPDGGSLGAWIESSWARLRSRTPRSLRTVTLVWWRPLLAASTDTYLSDLLSGFGCENVVRGGTTRYPPLAPAELVALEPDLVCLPDEPFRFLESHAERVRRLFAERGRQAPRTLVFDGSLITWFGARTRTALEELPRLIGAR